MVSSISFLHSLNTFKSVRWSPSTCAKFSLLSSASRALSRGRRKKLGTDRIAERVMISSEHLQIEKEAYCSVLLNLEHKDRPNTTGSRDREGDLPECGGRDHHFWELRIQWKFRHDVAYFSQVPIIVDRSEVIKQLQSSHQSLGCWWIHEIEMHLNFKPTQTVQIHNHHKTSKSSIHQW